MRDISNYSGLQTAQSGKQIQQISYVMLSNCNIDSSKNIDTTLYEGISSSQTIVRLNGDYSSFTGYIIVSNEVMQVESSSYNGTYTQMTVKRSRLFTVASAHSTGDIVRDGQKIDAVVAWNFNDVCESSQTNLFAPALSSGTIRIHDGIFKYDKTSTTKEYDIRKNKYIYIFNGANKEVLCDFIGYIFRPYSQDAFTYIIEFRDALGLIWNEPLDLNLNFSNSTVKEVLSQTLNISESMIEYANGTDEDDYFTIDEISTNEFSTYSEFLQNLCSNCLFRMVYNTDGKIRIFSDVNPQNTVTYLQSDTGWILSSGVWNDNGYWDDLETWEDVDDGSSISERKIKRSKYFTDLSANNDDNRIIINKVKCEYKERSTLYNREDFLDGSTLKYVNFLYSQSVSLQLVDSNGFKPNIINVGSNIDKIGYVSDKYYLMLKDSITGDEFYCGATQIDTSGDIEIVGGFDLDRQSIYRGKLNYLISQGYGSTRSFTLYYGQTELPTVFSLNFDNKDDNQLQIPILPQETVKYTCDFGSPTVDNQEFTGIIKEINSIFDTTLTSSQLKYSQRYSQGDNNIPVYLMTNKLSISGTGEGQYFNYSSFDNSNIELVIEKATNNEDDFNLYIENTLTGSYDTYTPISTLSSTIRVSNINFYNTGDVLKLSSSNQSDVNKESLYLKLKNEKWLIKNKFISNDSLHYITVDRPFPIGNGGAQFTFDKYPYSSIILLNNFYIKGNPVLEKIQNVEDKDQASIDDFGKQEYLLDGKFLKITDLEFALDYLKNGFKSTDVYSKKRFIEWETPYSADLQVLDVIILEDTVRMNIDGDAFIILEKSIDCVGTSTTKFKAISFNEYESTGENLNLENKISYLPINLPSYNHQGSSGLTNEENVNLDNKILSLQSDKIGLVTALQLAQANFKGTCNTNLREGYSTLDIISISGDLSTYNLLLLYQDQQCIIRMNDEFLLVKGTQQISDSDISTTVQIIERDLFNKGQTQISVGQRIEFYQILQITNEDGVYTTSTIIGNKPDNKYIEFSDGEFVINAELRIGGESGRINFTDSGFILDDYAGRYGDGGGIFIQDSNTDVEILWIASDSDSARIKLETLNERYFKIDQYTSSARVSSVDSNANKFLPLTITGLVIDRNDLNDRYDDGMLSYSGFTGFQIYENEEWKDIIYGVDGETTSVTVLKNISINFASEIVTKTFTTLTFTDGVLTNVVD